jgi:hypothetical protein
VKHPFYLPYRAHQKHRTSQGDEGSKGVEERKLGQMASHHLQDATHTKDRDKNTQSCADGKPCHPLFDGQRRTETLVLAEFRGFSYCFRKLLFEGIGERGLRVD